MADTGSGAAEEADKARLSRAQKALDAVVNYNITAERNATQLLRLDNEILKSELHLDNRQQKMMVAARTKEDMDRVQGQCKSVTRRVDDMRKKLMTMQLRFVSLKDREKEQDARPGGHDVGSRNRRLATRQISALETQLHGTTVKLSKLRVANRETLETIKEARRQRVLNDAAFKTFARKLSARRTERRRLLDRSAEVCAARDDLKQVLMDMREQATFSSTQFDTQWRSKSQEVSTNLDKLVELKERLALDEQEREALVGTREFEEERRKRKAKARSTWKRGILKAGGVARNQKAEALQKQFQRIMDATGVTDLKDIVATFTESENAHYSIYTYTNSLAADIERYEASTLELRGRVERLRAKQRQSRNLLQTKMEVRKATLGQLEQATDFHREAALQVQTTLAGLGPGLGSFLTLSKARVPADGPSVGASTIELYLGLLENRLDEIIRAYYQRMKGSNDPVFVEMDIQGSFRGMTGDDDAESVAGGSEMMGGPTPTETTRLLRGVGRRSTAVVPPPPAPAAPSKSRDGHRLARLAEGNGGGGGGGGGSSGGGSGGSGGGGAGAGGGSAGSGTSAWDASTRSLLGNDGRAALSRTPVKLSIDPPEMKAHAYDDHLHDDDLRPLTRAEIAL